MTTQVATPAEIGCALHAGMSVPPSLKAMAPGGEPPAEDTVAVKVTFWPKVVLVADWAMTMLVMAGLTVWLRTTEVLAANEVAPEYEAVSVCAPRASVAMAQVAEPEAMGRATQAAKSTPSTWKVTVPVGTPPDEVTLAVNVTELPKLLKEDGAVTEVVVGAWFTVCARATEVLAMNDTEPRYSAVMLCAPTTSVLMEQGAEPPDTVTALQLGMVTPASLNTTVPVGVPPLEETVAVKVYDWPKVLVSPPEPVIFTAVAAWLTSCARSAEVLPVNDALPA